VAIAIRVYLLLIFYLLFQVGNVQPKFIAVNSLCQGMKGHFWQMIAEHQCSVIIMFSTHTFTVWN